MRIGIDARVLDKGMTGTGRYLLNILNEIPNQDSKNEYFLITNSNLVKDFRFYKIIRYPESKLPFKVYSQIYLNFVLPRILKNHKIDLLFSPNILVPLVDMGKTKIISVVHDVIPKVFPEYYPFFYKLYLRLFLSTSLKKSDIVITVSEFSKLDINKYFDIPLSKIKVVYNSVPDNFCPLDYSEKEISDDFVNLQLPNRYLLYVGVIEKRKNILSILDCVDLLIKRGAELKLVLVGRPGYGFNKIYTEIVKRDKYVKYYEYVPDGILELVYNHSFVFIFPSLYEGFGIPPLEAMKCGIPVITSNTSSLPEVVGDAGLKYEPNDYEEMAEAVLKLNGNPDYYIELSSKSLLQAEKFNITKITRKLIDIFIDVNKRESDFNP